MIEAVCTLINDSITGAYFGRKAGAVTRVGIDQGGKKVYFPFDHATKDCNKDNAVHPDEQYKMVSWFETGEVEAVQGVQAFVAQVRLIGWLNLPKLGTRDRTLTGQIESDIINQMNRLKGISNGAVRISRVSFVKALKKDLTLFQNYSFKEDTNYFFGDFDFFGHVYNVAFTIDCQEVITTEIC